VTLTNETAGAYCANGGTKICAGLDANRNGVLDTNEITTFNYICNGGIGNTTSSVVLSSITVTASSLSLVTGTTLQFAAVGSYSDNTTRDITASVTWSSSNNSFASVSASGLATGVYAGNTLITATSGSVTGSASLTVLSPGDIVDEFTYKFDETIGSTAINSSANYFNGTIYGASRVAGKVGNALHFGSSGARVEILLNGFIPFPTSTISIDTWVQLDTISAGSVYQIVGNGSGGTTSLRFQINNGKLEFLLNDNYAWRSVILGSQSLAANTWYHVAVTYDGTTATTYINGAVDNTTNITYKITTVYNTLYIASFDYGQNQLLGTIDELRISKDLRSATEITNYYQATK